MHLKYNASTNDVEYRVNLQPGEGLLALNTEELHTLALSIFAAAGLNATRHIRRMGFDLRPGLLPALSDAIAQEYQKAQVPPPVSIISPLAASLMELLDEAPTKSIDPPPCEDCGPSKAFPVPTVLGGPFGGD